MADSAHRVVVVGGGFGGLQAVQKLRHLPVEVTLVDRRNFHLFQPLTYQVATGALSPGQIAQAGKPARRSPLMSATALERPIVARLPLS